MKKEERITGEKRIEQLFAIGNAFMAYPFRVVFRTTQAQTAFPLSVLVSVPKKRLKSAVKRNRVKRLVREAFRLNKHLFYDGAVLAECQIDAAFIYVKNEPADYREVEKAVQKALGILAQYLKTEDAEC